jgi:hypothetical protein
MLIFIFISLIVLPDTACAALSTRKYTPFAPVFASHTRCLLVILCYPERHAQSIVFRLRRILPRTRSLIVSLAAPRSLRRHEPAHGPGRCRTLLCARFCGIVCSFTSAKSLSLQPCLTARQLNLSHTTTTPCPLTIHIQTIKPLADHRRFRLRSQRLLGPQVCCATFCFFFRMHPFFEPKVSLKIQESFWQLNRPSHRWHSPGGMCSMVPSNSSEHRNHQQCFPVMFQHLSPTPF